VHLRVLLWYLSGPNNTTPLPRPSPQSFPPLFSLFPILLSHLTPFCKQTTESSSSSSPLTLMVAFSAPRLKLFSHAGVRSSGPLCTETFFWESGHHHLAVLLYSWHFRHSACKKKMLDFQGHNSEYWSSICSPLMVFQDFLCGTLISKSHSFFWRCNGWVTCFIIF